MISFGRAFSWDFKKVFDKVQLELNQFGLLIYNPKSN